MPGCRHTTGGEGMKEELQQMGIVRMGATSIIQHTTYVKSIFLFFVPSVPVPIPSLMCVALAHTGSI